MTTIKQAQLVGDMLEAKFLSARLRGETKAEIVVRAAVANLIYRRFENDKDFQLDTTFSHQDKYSVHRKIVLTWNRHL